MPLILYMLLLLLLSLIPADESLPVLFVADLRPEWQNLMHIPAYLFLALIWLECSGSPAASAVFFYACGYGIINEFLQILIPGRFFSLSDMLLNSAGVSAGILIHRYYIAGNRKNKKVITI